MRTALRALGMAVLTLLAGAGLVAVGVHPAGFVFLPGFVVAWHGTATEAGGAAVFVGVNVVVWWAVWAVALGICRRFRV